MTGANYYCKTCLDILVRCYAGTFNDTKIEGLKNFLLSFNTTNVLDSEMDKDVFKQAVSNAIEHHRSSSISSIVADVPMSEA